MFVEFASKNEAENNYFSASFFIANSLNV